MSSRCSWRRRAWGSRRCSMRRCGEPHGSNPEVRGSYDCARCVPGRLISLDRADVGLRSCDAHHLVAARSRWCAVPPAGLFTWVAAV
jgi:hypothetical protein